MRITLGLMNATKFITAALFLSLVGFMSTPPASAETVMIFDRYFGDRSLILGTFSKGRNESIKLIISFPAGSKVIICPEHEWDLDQITTATRKLVEEINGSAKIDVFKTLKDSGFNNCKFR